MKVKCLQVFKDLKEDKLREVGEEFEVSPERFNEIKAILPDHIEKVATKKVSK